MFCEPGLCLENQGNYFDAIQGYREAIAATTSLCTSTWRLGACRGAGQPDDGAGGLFGGVGVDPRHAEALARLAWTQILMGDYAAAKRISPRLWRSTRTSLRPMPIWYAVFPPAQL